jgi:PAS domain S-box-containing protein
MSLLSQQEKELRECGEMYRDLCENANDLIQCVTPDGRILYVNRAWKETLGYGDEEVAGLTLFDIIHPDSQAHCMEAFKRVISGEGVDKVEAVFVAKNGQEIVVEGSANCRFEGGKPVSTRGIFRDITERKRVEEELQRYRDHLKELVEGRTTDVKTLNEDLRNKIIEYDKTEEELKNIFELSIDMICIADMKSNTFIKINPSFSSTLGYSDEELLARPYTDFIHPDDKAATFKIIEEKLAQGVSVINFENRYCCKDGSYKWLMWTAKPILGQGLSYAIARDITAGKKAEEKIKTLNESLEQRVVERTAELAKVNKMLRSEIDERRHMMGTLQESRTMLQMVMDSIPVRLFWKDRESIHLGCNQRFAEDAGLDFSEQIVGKNDYELSWNEQAELYRSDDRQVIQTGIPKLNFEEPRTSPDGTRLWLRTSKIPLKDLSGNIIGILGCYEDITEIKKMEEALLQSEKLKSIGTISAGIAHEFNNILAVISGNVQLLERKYKDHDELAEALRTIRKATDDGAEISSKMLSFTKSSQDTKELASFDIRDLIKQSIDFTMPRWKNMAQANGINYQIDRDGIREIPEVHCNPTELREVFINIISNALDAMPDGGTITVSTRCGRSGEQKADSKKENTFKRQSLNSELKGDFVVISFADTGKGMTEDVKKKIFDLFFTTRRPKGIGLGMSISYGIITRHGGKIEVESEVGKGSTFTLQFPIATRTCSTKEISEPEQETKGNSLNILVVDDEEVICDILEKFLSSDGHMVRTVDNGAEAIMLTKDCSYELVLCDMAMPEVFGYDVIKALNELERRPKIGIITGWAEKLKPMEDEAFKVDFIIKKPFEFSEITRHINNLFNSDL